MLALNGIKFIDRDRYCSLPYFGGQMVVKMF